MTCGTDPLGLRTFFLNIRPPLELLSVLGPLEWYMMPALDAALLCSFRAGSYLGCKSDWLRSFNGFKKQKRPQMLIFEVDVDRTVGRTCKVVDASTCHQKRKIGKRKKEKRNRVNALSRC